MLLLAIRFLAELAGVATLAFVGATAPFDGWARGLLAVVLPLVLVVTWAAVVAPNAENPLPQPIRQMLGTVLLVGAAAALAVAGHPWWAIAFASVVVADHALLLALGPGDPAATIHAHASHRRTA